MRTHVITEGERSVSEIVVGRALRDSFASVVAANGRRVALLCQPATVDLASAYGVAIEATGVTVTGLTLPDGEAAKHLSVVEDVYRSLNRAALTRDDLVVGIGGGALTDVAGFIAATYLRGVKALHVPTTLLGAVDAAIGGKTAINVDGKNMAGVFAHPIHVSIDIDVIDALDDRLKMSGSAEALKTGFIADLSIVEQYERDGLGVDFEEIVNRSVAVKASVVSSDFMERGGRAILNYGHTVGHAIETATGCTHGEAVSIGMVAAGAASTSRLGFNGQARQREVLASIGLPVDVSWTAGVHEEQIRALMALDKKRDHEGLRMVLLERFGSPVVVPADDATVRAALAAIGITS